MGLQYGGAKWSHNQFVMGENFTVRFCPQFLTHFTYYCESIGILCTAIPGIIRNQYFDHNQKYRHYSNGSSWCKLIRGTSMIRWHDIFATWSDKAAIDIKYTRVSICNKKGTREATIYSRCWGEAVEELLLSGAIFAIFSSGLGPS